MSCSDNTTNNRPVGISYNSRNRPAGLAELTALSVSSATVTQTLTSLSAIFTTVSAATYLGTAGGGSTTFTGLTDVVDTALTTAGQMLVVNSSNQAGGSSVTTVMADNGYITGSTIAATYATIASVPTALSSLVTDVLISSPSANNVLTWNGTKWINSIPAGGGSTTFVGLSDVADTALNTAGRMIIVDSSNNANGSSVATVMTDNGYITGATIASTYATLSNFNAHTASAVHWDLATLNTNYINATGDSSNFDFYFSGLSATNLSATNFRLGGVNHTAQLALQSDLNAHTASAVHWDLATLNTNYINASGDSSNFGFYLSSLSSTTISATNNISVETSAPTLAAHLTRRDYVDGKFPKVLFMEVGNPIRTVGNLSTASAILFSSTLNIATSGFYNIRIFGDILTSGNTPTVTIRVGYGGTLLYGKGSAFSSDVDLRPFELNLMLIGVASNSQRLNGSIKGGFPLSGTQGYGDWGDFSGKFFQIAGTSAETPSDSKILYVSIQFDASSAGNFFKVYGSQVINYPTPYVAQII